jgi:hypothetical protein
MPNPARTAVSPLPVTSQANPTRGARSTLPSIAPFGSPDDPSSTMPLNGLPVPGTMLPRRTPVAVAIETACDGSNASGTK